MVNLAAAVQEVILRQGVDADVARQITRLVKDSKLKVQASIQGEKVRITGKQRDELQSVHGPAAQGQDRDASAVQQFSRLASHLGPCRIDLCAEFRGRLQHTRPQAAERLVLEVQQIAGAHGLQ